MSIGDIATLVVPLVLPVVVGWVLVRVRLAQPGDAKPLTTVFLWVCAPAELVVTLAGEDLGELLDGRLLAGTVAAFVIVYVGVFVVFRFGLRRSDAVAAFGAFTAAGFNALAIGLPVMLGLFGSQGSIPAVIATIVFLAALVPVTLVIAGADAGAGGRAAALRSALFTTATNPIVVATVIGVLLAGFDIGLPDVVDQSLSTLGAATVVTALVALGMTVDVDAMRSGEVEMIAMSVVRVVLAPLIALAMALVFGTDDLFSAAFVVLFAQPTAKTVFVLAEQTGVYETEASSVVALTTISSLVVLPIWIVVCDHIWPTAFT